jgi:long-chain acyl-CoA synthetase
MDKPWLSHYEQAVPHSLAYPQIPIGQMLMDSSRSYPENTAVHLVLSYAGPLTIGGKLSYRELGRQVDGFASALYALGVRKGDRVALMLPNLPQFVIAFYGAEKIGAIVVNTNPTYTPPEIQHQLSDAGAETVVVISGFYNKIREIQSQTPLKRVIITDVADYVPGLPGILAKRKLMKDGLMVDVADGNGVYHFRPLIEAHPEPPPQVEVLPSDIALFQYTGGTTGIPKAAMLTHGNLVANTVQIRHWLVGMKDGEERMMGAIPFFHVYGMTVAMSLAMHAASLLTILPNPRPIDMVMKAIHKERSTLYPGVPAMYIGIINHPDVGEYDLRSVTACISGAAPLPMDVQVKFGEITGGRLVEGYGLTEAAPVTHANPIYGERRAGSIGLPMPDVEAKIMDYETLVEKPIGQDGELWLRGPQVMVGYWNKPEETAQTITSDGWLRTGDIAHMDQDGYFYIVDRLKDIIIASGFNIVPREVEEVLFQHPKVQEAVVAGIPDAYRGETVKAYIVLKPGETATSDEIRAFCKERLAPYKVPTQVEFRSELPKTMVGKFLRRVLIEEERKKAAAARSPLEG